MYTCICIHVYMYVCIHTYMHACIHTYIHMGLVAAGAGDAVRAGDGQVAALIMYIYIYISIIYIYIHSGQVAALCYLATK